MQFLKDNKNGEQVYINSLLKEISGDTDNAGLKIILARLHTNNFIELSNISLFDVQSAGVLNDLTNFNISAKIRPEGEQRLKEIYQAFSFNSVEDLELSILTIIKSGKGTMSLTVFNELKMQPAFRLLKREIFDSKWNELLDQACITQCANNDYREVRINNDLDCFESFYTIKQERERLKKDSELKEVKRVDLIDKQIEITTYDRIIKKYWFPIIILTALISATIGYIVRLWTGKC